MLCAGCAGLIAALSLSASAYSQVQLPDGFADEPLIAGLNIPVAMAPLPDGLL
jgi:hypothetical protein